MVGVEPAAVVETHISVLFFYGDRVYKVRKPVVTPFLDFSSRELRLADCRREVALNRRLSPDVYLGVDDIVDEAGRPVDHVVVMRRLPQQRRLGRLIAEPDFDPAHLTAIARVLAAFHARAQRADDAGSVEHLAGLWTSNLDETAPYLDVRQIGELALTYLEGRHPLLRQRVADGRIVDGHGDLMADDIFCLDDGPRILDCIEFDARFRCGDVLYDTAFLAMDLEHRGRADLARHFLDAYREFSAETHPASLEHWYIAYRALVRAKIACLRQDNSEAGAFLAQAQRHLVASEVRVILVGGLPGTGKSTLAAGLADRLGWQLLRSDAVRKELAGLAQTDRADAEPFVGIYSPRFTDAVYRELLHRAEVAVGLGESVVLDATWLDPRHRAQARTLAARCEEFCCVLDLEEASARLRARAAVGGDPSDATPDVLASLARRSGLPWPEACQVDTSAPPAEVLELVAQRAAGG